MQFESNIYDTSKIIDDLINDSVDTYQIPQEAFSSYHVKRGLREQDGTGVTAGVTKIGNAHGYVMYEGEKTPVEGKLEYRNDAISFIADSVSTLED